MSTLICNLILWNRQTSAFEAAELWHPMGNKHNRDFDNLWKPAFAKRRSSLTTGESAADAQIQDDHWKWSEKNVATLNRLDYETFGIKASGVTQGMMLVNLTQEQCLTHS